MNIEVMGEGATKGTALTWLCEYLGKRLADAWAFGDNINAIRTSHYPNQEYWYDLCEDRKSVV